MARKDALLRLHQRLVAQRDELRNKLGHDVSSIGRTDGAGTSDLGDLANEDTEQEINSQIAAIESRELVRIQRAIDAIREGHYGKCDGCNKSIPVSRLNALPYTTLCIGCQELQEATGVEFGNSEADWDAAYQMEARQSDRDLTIGDLNVVAD